MPSPSGNQALSAALPALVANQILLPPCVAGVEDGHDIVEGGCIQRGFVHTANNRILTLEVMLTEIVEPTCVQLVPLLEA